MYTFILYNKGNHLACIHSWSMCKPTEVIKRQKLHSIGSLPISTVVWRWSEFTEWKLNSFALWRNVLVFSKVLSLSRWYGLNSCTLLVKLQSVECHRIHLVLSKMFNVMAYCRQEISHYVSNAIGRPWHIESIHFCTWQIVICCLLATCEHTFTMIILIFFVYCLMPVQHTHTVRCV